MFRTTCDSAASMTAWGASVHSAAQSRKLDRNPCGTAAIPSSLGERVAARARELAVGQRLLAGLGQRNQRHAAQSELAIAAPDHEPLNPAPRSRRLHVEVQAIAVAMSAGRGRAHEGGRQRLVGMAASSRSTMCLSIPTCRGYRPNRRRSGRLRRSASNADSCPASLSGSGRELPAPLPLQLPVALDAERAVFVYVDPGYETATAHRSWGAAHREIWMALRERGRRIEVVAVARTWEELNRAGTVLDNWARDPRPSEFNAEVSLEIARIEQAILKGDVRLLKEVCGDIQGGLRRTVELKERARRQAGRGLIHRTTTWQSARLACGRFGLGSRRATPGLRCARHVRGRCTHGPGRDSHGHGLLSLVPACSCARRGPAGCPERGSTDRDGSDPPGRGPGTGLALGVFLHPAPTLQGSLPFQ